MVDMSNNFMLSNDNLAVLNVLNASGSVKKLFYLIFLNFKVSIRYCNFEDKLRSFML